MKQYEYYIFDKDIPFEYNFFLTKILQSYRLHAAKGESSPFSYISVDHQRKILGRHTSEEKISHLKAMGYLDIVSVGSNQYGNILKGFVPKITSGYERAKTPHPKISKYYVEKNKELPKLNKSVFKGFSHAEIGIDREEWRSVVRDAYKVLKPNSDGVLSSKRKYNKNMNGIYESIIDWNRGNIHERMNMCSVDQFGNRFHSIFTRIPKAVRRNNVILGESECTEIDLAQSQPSILAQLLQDTMGDNSFSDFIFSGEYLYHHLGNGNKEEGKSIFHHSIFGTKIDRAFAKKFKDTKACIKDLKYTPQRNNCSSKGYSNLCFLLQRTETEIFQRIWNLLVKERIAFIPIHDSIVIQQSNYTEAFAIMNRILPKYLCNYCLR